jgi:hypothetical protein
MLNRLTKGVSIVLAGLAASCSNLPQNDIDAGSRATLDIQNNCVNLTPVAMEVCRRSGANGLSGGSSMGM